MKSYYQIAGLTVAMDSFGRTIEQAEKYRCETFEKVDAEIESPWQEYKIKYPKISDDLGEYISTAMDFYKKLLRFDGFMLHSSAVVVDGKAYLFTADSGTGKSTHTSLWMKLFGDRAYILNDDKPALRLINGTWYAYGTPWSGKHDISENACAELAGIAIIERGEENHIEICAGMKAIRNLLRQSNRPKDAESRELLLKLLDKLIMKVPIWSLQCNMDLSAAVMSYEVMSGGNFECQK